jgi:hypothetical protein
MACDTGAENLNLGDCFLLNETQTVSQVYDTPTVLFNQLVRYSFVAAGLIIFCLILYAGYLFITGDVKGKDKAQEILTSALIGFLVMFSAYWILQIVAVITGANVIL